MKCTKCGAECREDVKFCTKCGAPMDCQDQAPAGEGTEVPEAKEDAAVGQPDGTSAGQPDGASAGQPDEASAGQSGQTAADQPEQPTAGHTDQLVTAQPSIVESKPNKKALKIILGVIGIVVIIAIAGLAYVKMNAKNPKQVVIDAFKSVYTDGAVSPSEELFGWNEFAKAAMNSDRESGITMKMESCSDPSVNALAGSGMRLESKDDKTNDKSSINMGMIYNGMDLVNFNAYFGDDTLMASVPELSDKVFTLDMGDGLGDRIKNSPVVGPFLSENGVDVDGLTEYFNQLMADRKNTDKGSTPFDLKALVNRYKEGCKAQENFKEAMTVTEADKAIYTINGRESKCQGYDVVISKDSVIEFLRTSSDFFLQDETLKGDYLKQLEATVRMSELMGGNMSGTGNMSAQQMQEMAYGEVKGQVEQMINYLDKSLTDVKMTVYVDKKGNLAAVNGSTILNAEAIPDMENGNMTVTFQIELQGGTYPTQNVKGSVVLGNGGDTIKLDLLKQGTFDGKKLTSDLSLDATAPDESSYNFTYSGTYDSKDGSYHASAELGGEGSKLLKISAAGVIDELKKGDTIHMDIDSLEIAANDNSLNLVLSGEYYNRPLSGEVVPLEGETMDVLSATTEDWNKVVMQTVFKAIGLASQLGIPLY